MSVWELEETRGGRGGRWNTDGMGERKARCRFCVQVFMFASEKDLFRHTTVSERLPQLLLLLGTSKWERRGRERERERESVRERENSWTWHIGNDGEDRRMEKMRDGGRKYGWGGSFWVLSSVPRTKPPDPLRELSVPHSVVPSRHCSTEFTCEKQEVHLREASGSPTCHTIKYSETQIHLPFFIWFSISIPHSSVCFSVGVGGGRYTVGANCALCPVDWRQWVALG